MTTEAAIFLGNAISFTVVAAFALVALKGSNWW